MTTFQRRRYASNYHGASKICKANCHHHLPRPLHWIPPSVGCPAPPSVIVAGSTIALSSSAGCRYEAQWRAASPGYEEDVVSDSAQQWKLINFFNDSIRPIATWYCNYRVQRVMGVGQELHLKHPCSKGLVHCYWRDNGWREINTLWAILSLTRLETGIRRSLKLIMLFFPVSELVAKLKIQGRRL